MLDVKTAYDVVQSNNPRMKAIVCNEYNDFYAFGLVPDDLKDGDGFANSCVYTVDKNSGKYSVVHFMKINGEIIREIDIDYIV